MTPQPHMELSEEGVPRQMPLRLHPCLHPFARTLPSLASRAAFDTWHSLSVFLPETCEAHTGEPTRHAGMNAAEAQEACLLRCHLPCACPQARRERLVQPVRLAADSTGADQVIGVATDPGLASTTGVAHLFTAQAHGIMSIHMGQHRRANPALGCSPY